jgi:hypothetical protein
MKIEFTRAEVEAIILAYIKEEVAPYIKFVRVVGVEHALPSTITVETADAAQ